MTYRTLSDGQRCQVLITDLDGSARVVWESDAMLLEAPNWTLDGRALILNGNGVLWRLDLGSGQLDPIPLSVPELNNDHVLDPDGETVYLSANDGHIYRGSLAGGDVVRITNDGPPDRHFLHGVSPDGSTLAYVGVQAEGDDAWAHARIHTIPAHGGPDRQLTDNDTDSPTDGCEYSPDGRWIYFNSEQFSDTPGHAQIARMRPDGSELEQLTFDEGVNWFPHISPDGTAAVYLSFPPGTTGHPADLEVELKLVRNDAWQDASTVVRLPGGQGTINVNSWAPTGDRFAYVAYPIG